MYSNLPDQEIIHEVDNKTDSLIVKLVTNMKNVCNKAYKLVMDEYFEYIKMYCLCLRMIYNITDTLDDVENVDDSLILCVDNVFHVFTTSSNKFRQLKHQNAIRLIKEWLEFPMIGYNNSFYDINICKEHDFIDKFGTNSALKMGSRYKTMSNGRICILDQLYYCSASPSLDAYLKSRQTNCVKGHFPYKW